MIFSVYSVKIVFLFPTNITWPFCWKSKDDLLLKKYAKDDISGIMEKNGIYPKKSIISSDRKLKDDTKVYFYKKVPMILWIFNGDLHKRFQILLSTEKGKKKQEAWYVGSKFYFFFKSYGWRNSATLSPQKLYLGMYFSAT